MLKAFFKRLKHPDPQVRIKAADELGKLEDVRALGPLKEALETETNPNVRRCIRAAGKRIWQASQERTKPPRKHNIDEDALAASIVQEAMSTHNMPKPSLGGVLKDMANNILLGGIEGAAFSALSRQAQQIGLAAQLSNTAEDRDLIHKAMNQLQDATEETSEALDVPENKPIIRRLRPKED